VTAHKVEMAAWQAICEDLPSNDVIDGRKVVDQIENEKKRLARSSSEDERISEDRASIDCDCIVQLHPINICKAVERFDNPVKSCLS
jgi:hypothetical protein